MPFWGTFNSNFGAGRRIGSIGIPSFGLGGETGVGFSLGPSTIAVQTDNKIIAGLNNQSRFNYQSQPGLIRLNSDGTKDESFDIGSGFNGRVIAVAIQDDGKIICGGQFTQFQGSPQNRLIRLNTDGSKDESFDIGAGASGAPESIAIQADNKILVGGPFTQFGGTGSARLVRLNTDGTVDSSFNNGGTFFNNSAVYDMTVLDDGKIICVGGFTAYNGVTANRIIRLNANGSIDNTFDVGTGFDTSLNFVFNVKIDSQDRIVIGGSFTTFNSLSQNHLIRLNPDGTKDTSFDIGSGFNAQISSNRLAIQSNDRVLVVGQTSALTLNGVALSSRFVRLNSDGSLDESFVTNGIPSAIALLDNGQILFSADRMNNTQINGLGKMSSNGTLISSAKPAFGSQEFINVTTTTWTAPPDVTSVSVVCIGAGGAGDTADGTGYAGGGGGLGWKNNITVVPGNTYSVVVGNSPDSPSDGEPSYFIDLSTVAGLGGLWGGNGGSGGGFVGDGGGNGGDGGLGSSLNGDGFCDPGGGGGAGGYTDKGGDGGTAVIPVNSQDTSLDGQAGAGGGAGGGAAGYTSFAGNTQGTRGGGVGLRGAGANGTGGRALLGSPTRGGDGSIEAGFARGSGGSGSLTSQRLTSTAETRFGGLRIVWGANRAYPSTNIDF